MRIGRHVTRWVLMVLCASCAAGCLKIYKDRWGNWQVEPGEVKVIDKDQAAPAESSEPK